MHGLGDPLLDLDLTNRAVKEAASILPPGRYTCVSRHAELKQGAKQRSINVVLEDVGGAGIITARLNVWSSNDQAREISQEQLKSLCTFGKHPNPNKPLVAGLQTLVGLPVGVVVKTGKPYEKDGKTLTGVEVAGFYALDDAEFAKAKATPGQYRHRADKPSAGGRLDDDIPF